MNNDKDTKLIVDLIEGALQEEGYEVLRYSDSKKHYTTADDALAVKRYDGIYFTVTINRIETNRNPYTNEIHKDSDTFESLKAEKALEGLK
jgi:hypothetical protein